MNRSVWIPAGIGVFILGALNVVLGLTLVPSMAEAQEKGTGAGWWLIWIVIGLTVVCAVALGGFLLAAGLGKVPETAD